MVCLLWCFYQYMTRWRHPALAEFAISLEGFPESATDEQQILEFVRQSFGTSAGEVDRFFLHTLTLDTRQIRWSGGMELEFCTKAFSNEQHLSSIFLRYLSVFLGSRNPGCWIHLSTNPSDPRPDNGRGIEDLQVSVCYDYRDRRARVNELWEKILDSRGCPLQVGGWLFFDPFVDAVNGNRCIYGIYLEYIYIYIYITYICIYIYDIWLYDIWFSISIYTPVFLYFIYVRYRSHLGARRIPSQLSTGSIRQPSELGLVGGGQAGSEVPAGFFGWFLLNDFSLPYGVPTVSLPVFFFG